MEYISRKLGFGRGTDQLSGGSHWGVHFGGVRPASWVNMRFNSGARTPIQCLQKYVIVVGATCQRITYPPRGVSAYLFPLNSELITYRLYVIS